MRGMWVGRVRRGVVIVAAGLIVLLFAAPAGAADTGPQITEVVPVRIHGTDTSWPPVLVFCALVVVVGGVVAAFLFMRRVREAVRSGGSRR